MPIRNDIGEMVVIEGGIIMEDELEKHIVTGQSIGFDYQFYYFVFLQHFFQF